MPLARVPEALRRQAWAWGGAVLGTLLVLGSVIFMNEQAVNPKSDDTLVATSINVERREQKPKTEQPKPRPKPKAPPRARVAPSVGIESSLAGMDFGLPQYEEASLVDAASILGEGDSVMTDETADTPPRPVLQTAMPFPPAAKAKGVTGYVVLSLLIGTDGTVEKVKVVEASPPGVFDDVAASGVQSWRFEPASYEGKAVRVWARQKITFNLG